MTVGYATGEYSAEIISLLGISQIFDYSLDKI